METAHTKSAMLLFALARHGIVSPDQIQELGREKIEQLAATIAKEIANLQNQELWSPLHTPSKNRMITIGRSTYEPRKALHVGIAHLNLPTRENNILLRNRINVIGRLVALGQDGVEGIKGGGPGLYHQAADSLRSIGIQFAESDVFSQIDVKLGCGDHHSPRATANAELAGMFFPFEWLELSSGAMSLCLGDLKGIKGIYDVSQHTTRSLSVLVADSLEIRSFLQPANSEVRPTIQRFTDLLVQMAAFAESVE